MAMGYSGIVRQGESQMLKLWTSAILFFAAPISIAGAADIAPLPTEPEWTFTLAPYVWAAGLQGKVAQFGLPEVDVDATFGDILKHFDIGVMAAGEVRHDRFSIATD